MSDGIKDGIVEVAARIVMSTTKALYENFGETIIWAAFIALIIVPIFRRLFLAWGEDEGEKVIAGIVNAFLLFASFGIAERAAYWAICQGKDSFWLEIGAFLGGFIAALAIWWCSLQVGDEVALRIAGQPGKWFRKALPLPPPPPHEKPNVLKLGREFLPVDNKEKVEQLLAKFFYKRPTFGDKATASAAEVRQRRNLTHAAAERGNPLAQRKLGYMYECGCGVPKNARVALLWYQKAANQGDVQASIALARLQKDAYLHL